MTVDLDARYGRGRSFTRRNRLIFFGGVGGLVVILLAWLLWAGLFSPSSQIAVEDTGHVIASSSLVQVKFQLTVAPGTKSSCAVQALNESFGVVGWRIIDVPASSERVRALESSVRTSQLAVSGLIYRCWPA